MPEARIVEAATAKTELRVFPRALPFESANRVSRRNPKAGMQRDLVALARDGDHDAFSSLAASSIGRLYGVARAILRDGARAEDVVQDALVLAWRDLPALRDVDRFDGWLYRLVVRAACREAQQARRRSIVELRVLPDDRAATAQFETSVADRDRLDRAFERLRPDHRAVVVLQHNLGLGLLEIADILEIPVGTAKSRLFRAMQALRSALDADDRDPAVANLPNAGGIGLHGPRSSD